MKAAVMKSENGTSVILTEDGLFHTIPGSYAVGQEIQYPVQGVRRRRRFVAAAVAACLCLAMVTGLWSWQTQMVYATVSLGETLSIEYHLNRLGHVLRVVALEPEAEAIAQKLNDHDLRGESLRAAIADTEAILQKDLSSACSSAKVKCSSKKHKEALACQLKPAKKPGTTNSKTAITATRSLSTPTAEEPSANANAVTDDEETVGTDVGKTQDTTGRTRTHTRKVAVPTASSSDRHHDPSEVTRPAKPTCDNSKPTRKKKPSKETQEENKDSISSHQCEEDASTSVNDEDVSAHQNSECSSEHRDDGDISKRHHDGDASKHHDNVKHSRDRSNKKPAKKPVRDTNKQYDRNADPAASNGSSEENSTGANE